MQPIIKEDVPSQSYRINNRSIEKSLEAMLRRSSDWVACQILVF